MHQNLEARNFIFFLLYMHFGRQHAVFSIKGYIYEELCVYSMVIFTLLASIYMYYMYAI